MPYEDDLKGIEAARAAGYDDDAITAHLATTRPEYGGAIKAGYKLSDIEDHLRKMTTSPSASQTPAPASTSPAATAISATKPVPNAPVLDQAVAVPSTITDALAQAGLEAAGGAEFAHAEVLRRADRAGNEYYQKQAALRLAQGKTQDKLRKALDLEPTNSEEAAKRKNLEVELERRQRMNPDEAEESKDAAKDIFGEAAARGANAPPGPITTVARGLAKGAGMAATGAIPGVGLPLMATEGAAQAYGAAKAAGKNEHESEGAGVRTLVALSVFGGVNKAVSAGIAKYLGNAPALKKFLVNVLGQDAGNEVASRVISAGEAAMDAPEGKKLQAAAEAAKKFDLESSSQNLGFAVLGAAHAAGEKGAAPSPELKVFADEAASIPEDQFDGAIKKYRSLPDSDPRKQIFEAEVAKRAAITPPIAQTASPQEKVFLQGKEITPGTQGTAATPIPAAPSPSVTPQAPDIEQVSQPKTGGRSALFQQAKDAADQLAQKAEAAKDIAPASADAAAKLAEELKAKASTIPPVAPVETPATTGEAPQPIAEAERTTASQAAPAQESAPVEPRSQETPGVSSQEPPAMRPAIQTPSGQVFTGEDHVSAYETAKKTVPDTSGSQEGFVNTQGQFISREQAAKETGLPTETEEGKLHSSDLPGAIKENAEPEPPPEVESPEEHARRLKALEAAEKLVEDDQPTEQKRAADMTKEEKLARLNQELKDAPARDKKAIRARIKSLSEEPEQPEMRQPDETPEPAKEIWQKTRADIEGEGASLARHRLEVRDAVKRGKQVPLEVLEGFKGSEWADKARTKMYGEAISDTLLSRIQKALEGDPRKMYGDHLFIQTVGKPILRGALKIVREGIEAGKLAKDVIADAMTYLRANVKDLDEEKAKVFLARSTGEPVIDQTVYHSTKHPGNLSAEAAKRSSSVRGIGLYTSPDREAAEGWGGDKASVRTFNLKLHNPIDLRDVALSQQMTREQLAKTLTDHGFPVTPNDIPESEGDTSFARPFDDWKPHIEALTRTMHAAGFDGLLDKTYVNGKEIEEHIPFSEKSLIEHPPYSVPNSIALEKSGKPVKITASTDRGEDGKFYVHSIRVEDNATGSYDRIYADKSIQAGWDSEDDARSAAFDLARQAFSTKKQPQILTTEQPKGGDSVENEQTQDEEKGRQEILTERSAGEGEEVPSQSPEPTEEGLEEIPEDPTGIQNAVTEALRDKYGFEERAKVMRKAFPGLVEEAKAKLAENPEAGAELVDELSKTVRPLTDEEDALLTLELANRQTAFEKADTASNLPTADSKTASRLAEARQKLFDILGIAENVGTQNARGLNARKLMINRDFSLASLLRKETRARGRALEPEEQARVVAQAKEIARLKKELEEKQETERQLTEAQQATRMYEETVADLKKQLSKNATAAKEPIEKRLTKTIPERVVSFAKSARESALARIKDRKGKMFADPLGVMSALDLADHAIVGATHLIEGAVTFGKWANKMREDFGDGIKPHLRVLFDASKAQAKKMLDAKEKTPLEIKSRAKAEATAGEELSHRTVAELARAHINAGIHGEDNVMKAVHADIKEAYPNSTERDVRRAFSEYGKVKFPSKDAVDKELRELRTLTRLQESIDRETDGLDALHSGMQRDKATQSIRDKQRRLNELLKARETRGKTPSPEKLATRLDAKKTALRNAIADTENELAGRPKPPPGSPVALDPEAENLTMLLQALKEKQREVASEENPPKTEAEKQVAQLSKVKERLDELLSGKRDAKKPKDFNPLSQAAEDIQAEIHAMQELAAQMRRDSKPKGDPGRAAEQAKIKALEESIDRYQQKTAAKDFTTAAGVKLGPDTPEVARLKKVRDSRRSMYEAVKKAGLPVKTPDEIYNARRLPQINKRIEELEARQKSGDFEPRPKKTQRPPTAEVAKASAKLDEAKKEIQKGWEKIQHERRSKPQQAWDAFKQVLKSITAVTTAGHGTVGMITHAGALIWRPSRAAIYWKNFGRQFPMWASKSFHEQAIYALKNDPEFEAWKDAGASIDPDRTYTDYGMYAKWLGKLAAGGERGFDALKLTRLALNKADWENVSPEIKANPEAATETRNAIAAINNKATGAIPKTSPFAEPGARNKMETATYNLSKNPLADAVLFAPRLYASRWMRVVYDPVKTVGTFADWRNASPAERTAATTRAKHAAEFAAVYVGALLTNQAILSATGSDQKVNFSDPEKKDWLKFKGGGKEILADGGLLDPIRLIGQIVWGDLVNNRTANEKFRYSTRYAKAANDLGQYLRGKLNPTLGVLVDSATGSDFTGRPLPWNKDAQNSKEAEYHPRYTWTEWLAEHGPIPIAGGTKVVYDEMRKRGLSAPQAKDIINGAAATAFEMTGLHINDEKKAPPKRFSVFK